MSAKASRQSPRLSHHGRYRWLFAGACCSSLLASSMVRADDKTPTTVDTVVVTAQKRVEDVSKVPVTVQALGGQQLATQRIVDLQNVIDMVPNASLAGESSKGSEIYQIRGVAVGDSGGGDATIASYLDDFAYSIPGSPYNLPADLYDINRVEVLKGPQGTLYGSNSLGGVIKVVTNDPDLHNFDMSGDASVGAVWKHDENYSGDLMLNMPIVDDKLAIRLVVSGEHLSGFSYLPVLGIENGNKADIVNGRVKILFHPTEKLSILASVYRYEVAQAFTNRLDAINPPTDDASQPNGQSPTDYTIGALRVGYDLGWADLTSSSGYMVNHYAIILSGCQSQLCYNLDTKEKTTSFNQEIRLTSKGTGPWHWIGGLYYSDAEASGPTNFQITPPLIPTPTEAPPVDSISQSDLKASEIAGFGEVSYDLFGGKLVPLAGLRYSYDARTLGQNSIATLNGTILADTTAAVSEESTHVNPRANLSYYPTDNGMIYFNAAEGYRPGALQTAANIAALEAVLGVQAQEKDQTDTLWSLEAGGKWNFFDRTLNVSASYYHLIWNQAQLQTGFSGTSGILNVGNVTGNGVELYVSDRTPIPGLRVQLSAGWNSTVLSDIDPNILARLTFLHNGIQLPPVPKVATAVIVNYEHPTSYNDIVFVADGRYQYRSKEKDLSTPLQSADLNLISLDVGFRKGAYTVQAFVDNLTNDEGPSIWEEGRLIMPFPRTIGVRFAFTGF